MNLILSLVIFFTLGLNNTHPIQTPVFKLSTFTKVPDDFMGCGDDYYLSKKDEKQVKLICRTDYARALIRVNNRLIVLKANYKISDKENHAFTNGNYTLIIKNGPLKSTGDEDYTMKPIITLKLNSKVIWTKNLIGDGGC
ncbi:MAG: hypothetical protein JWR02_1808 [Mucilaginibacter sp.]|nr:hypothetical protein [Mucilaginibacter sp.]